MMIVAVVFFERFFFVIFPSLSLSQFGQTVCKRLKWQVFYRLLANVELPLLMLLFSLPVTTIASPPYEWYIFAFSLAECGIMFSMSWVEYETHMKPRRWWTSIDLNTIEHANIYRCVFALFGSLTSECAFVWQIQFKLSVSVSVSRCRLSNFASDWIAFRAFVRSSVGLTHIKSKSLCTEYEN